MRLVLISLGLALATLGCADDAEPSKEPSPELVPLALLDDWQSVAPEDDPLLTEADEAPTCVGPGFWIERDLGWIEIDSGVCNWVTMRAAARGAVERGQTLALKVSHYDLVAGAPAEASLRLELGDCEAWSKTVTIPSPAAVYEEQFPSPCALAENATILFHVHNHGQNTYQLQGLSALR